MSDRSTHLFDGRIDHVVDVEEQILLRNPALFSTRAVDQREPSWSVVSHSRRSTRGVDQRLRSIIFHRKLQCHRYGRSSNTSIISNRLSRRPSLKVEIK